jgi:FAD/FMN-containing dehydrogenase
VAPRKATGPDLMHALVGARGTLGLLTSATLRLARRGEVQLDAAFQLPTIEAGLAAARELLVRGGRPLELALGAAPPILRATIDGTPQHADAERLLFERVAAAHGGKPTAFTPLPRLSRAPHERFVPMDRILAAVPSAEGRVTGWHPMGAAVVDPTRAAEKPPLASSIVEGLKRRLDPDNCFPAWPGT